MRDRARRRAADDQSRQTLDTISATAARAASASNARRPACPGMHQANALTVTFAAANAPLDANLSVGSAILGE